VGLARFLLKRAQGAYVVSPRIKAEIQARLHPSFAINVIPIFIDLTQFKNRKKVYRESPTIVLLWVGRFESEKNPFLALHAFYEVHKKGFPAKLIFMGKGRLEKKLREQSRTMGIQDLVEFKAWQDPAETYAASDILLMTSLYEGYGMVIVEALATGIPVLATDVGIARDAGAIISHGDYTDALIGWIREGGRTGTLLFDPYKNEGEYLDRIKQDLQGCVEAYRGHTL
jgi:glycosyltransferase involved in cell wall biosynthesis